ncbi:MAG: ABC transporter substrate-binding protein [Actinobacteria bacterium]|nr:ABC transporter substrate-binding protein [Actinomycetota bacterium]
MNRLPNAGRIGVALAATSLVLTSVACASGSGSDNAGAACADSDAPLKVGHLNYYTGPFADVGPTFEAITDLTLGIINENPPLGRQLEVEHGDIGTVGEASVARNMLQRNNVDILLNPAHEYSSYREFILQQVQRNDGPLMPSVHGGSVDATIGGVAEEPLFRGAPMDTAAAVAGVLQVKQSGAQRVAVVATQISGSQLQKDAAIAAAEEIGLDVVAVFDVQPEQANYRSTISSMAGARPDSLLLFSQAEDGGTFVKQAAEAGQSLYIVGSQEWLQEAFPRSATNSAMAQHKAVLTAAFTHADSPAWEYMKTAWNESEYAHLTEPENSYLMQYYDLLNVTALAIEAAGSACASDWTEAMNSVSGGPGTVVHTYQEGVEALRNGEDIDYSGVTGDFDYTDTGVVSGLFGAYEWTPQETLELVNVLDGTEILDIDAKIQG